jgi:hypothetical protein
MGWWVKRRSDSSKIHMAESIGAFASRDKKLLSQKLPSLVFKEGGSIAGMPESLP